MVNHEPQLLHPSRSIVTFIMITFQWQIQQAQHINLQRIVALPIYSGGLGILAGDHLKTASDLGVPITGVGLLYQQGYFRQVLRAGSGNP